MEIHLPTHKVLCSASLLLASLAVGHAQSTWDYSATPDQNWSTNANWSTDASPAGTAVVFGNTGTTANSTMVGNIVDTSFTGANTLSSLLYNQSATAATAWQVTQIGAGQTLTVNGAFTVGGYTSGNNFTQTAFTGGGALNIDASSSSFLVSNGSNTSGGAGNLQARAVLDLSALSTFTANVSSFGVGSGSGAGYGTLYLADTSTITAGTFTSGGTASIYNSNISNTIYLGTTTTLNVGTLSLAGTRTFGQVKFRPVSSGGANSSAVSGGTLKIRGADGVSGAAMLVGGWTGAFAGNGSSIVDFTGGTVDARVTTLKVGTTTTNNNTNTVSAILTVDGVGSVFNVSGQVTVGEAMGGTNGTLNGILNVSGGAAFAADSIVLGNQTAGVIATNGTLRVSGANTSVTVNNNLTAGSRAGTAAVSATVEVSAGTLLIGGNLAEGSGAANVTSTVNLSGGTLDLTHGSISVDTFSFTGGALKNVASFSAAATGGLSLLNSSSLEFGIDASFTTLSLTGQLSLSSTANLQLSLADGFTPGASFLLVSNDDAEAISGIFGTINGAAVGVGNTFFLTNDQGSFQYELSYTGGDGNDLVITAVPEPATCLLAGVGLVGLLWRGRSVGAARLSP